MIADRILKIEESSTLAMAQKSRDLIQKGKKIINLSLGEPDFDTPNFIKSTPTLKKTYLVFIKLIENNNRQYKIYNLKN